MKPAPIQARNPRHPTMINHPESYNKITMLVWPRHAGKGPPFHDKEEKMNKIKETRVGYWEKQNQSHPELTKKMLLLANC